MKSAQDEATVRVSVNRKKDKGIQGRQKCLFWTMLLFFVVSILFCPRVFGAERVIAHGGGAYEGYETTNSLEAVRTAIANGIQWIELDMDLSADGKIIMIHDWDKTAVHYFGLAFSKKLTEDQFNRLSVHQSLEVLTFDKLIPLLDEYPDLRIVTDTKGDNIELLTTLAKNYSAYVPQMIPQIYDEEQWAPVNKLGFDQMIFTLYQQEEIEVTQLANFVKVHNIYAITMPDYYADLGYSKALAAEGVRVYVHPIGSMEEANTYLNQGAYGVYSGTLLPAEFQGVERTCYLMAADGDGGYEKLTDAQFTWKQIASCNEVDGEIFSFSETDLKKIELPLFMVVEEGDVVQFFFDDLPFDRLVDGLSEASDGKHQLRMLIKGAKGEIRGELHYLFWKEESWVRILDDKYSYRLENYEKPKDFAQVMDQIHADQSTSELLRGSLIAKAQEYLYYEAGASGEFRRSAEYFPAQLDTRGKVVLPLLDTALALGAESVTMEENRDMMINVDGQFYRAMVGGPYLRQGPQAIALEKPVSLYLNKATADGAFFRTLTGRALVEKDGLLIVLPEGVKVEKQQAEKLLSAAKELYHQEASQ